MEQVSRRTILGSAGAVAGAAAALSVTDRASAARNAKRDWQASYSGEGSQKPMAPAVAGKDYLPSETPGGKTLAGRVVDGVKVYHLAKQQSIEALKDFWLAQTELELLLAGGIPSADGSRPRDAEPAGNAGEPAGDH